MSRRMDREGVHRMEPQGITNRRFWDDPRCKVDERGWVQPFTNWQGWEELNRAAYALRCVLLFRQIAANLTTMRPIDWNRVNAARIESDLRTFHFSLARSRRCDRPAIP